MVAAAAVLRPRGGVRGERLAPALSAALALRAAQDAREALAERTRQLAQIFG